LKEAVVTDSTCLIALERLGQLDILPSLFEPIYALPEVSREFGTSLPWLKVVDLAAPPRPRQGLKSLATAEKPNPEGGGAGASSPRRRPFHR
jgi:hypothetical protein